MSHEDSLPPPPLQRFYDLKDLSEAGDEIVVTAAAGDLPRLAAWLGVEGVERFSGTVTLRRLAADRFGYDAVLEADLVQSCVVTLAPVPSHIVRRFSRTLRLAPRLPRKHRPVEAEKEKGGLLTLDAGDDEVPEELESSRFDLAGPLLEELSLGIEPYPRAPDAEFSHPEGAVARPEGPFAALKRLKEDPT